MAYYGAANNAYSTLASPASAGASSLTVVDGAVYPTIDAGHPSFRLELWNRGTATEPGEDAHTEIHTVTDVTGDVLTLAGTLAYDHVAGERASNVFDAATKVELEVAIDGKGDVTGPEGAVAGNLPFYADTTGKVLADSGVAAADVLTALPTHNLLSAGHPDTTTASPARGDLVTAQGATPKWARLAITAPAATHRNYMGAANGDTEPGYKALFDATVPVTQALGDAAAVGTAEVAARRDHKHAMPAQLVTASGLTVAGACVLGATAAGAVAELATTGSGSVVLATNPTLSAITITNTGAGTITLNVASDDAPAKGEILLNRCRGTSVSPTALADGDETFIIRAAGHDGTGYRARARILMDVYGAVSSNTVPMRIQFQTGTTSYATRMQILPDGKVGIGQVPTTGFDVALQTIVSTSSFPPLRSERSGTQANSFITALDVRQKTTADMTDGCGVLASFSIQDSAGVSNIIAEIGAKRAGADNTGDFYIKPRAAGTAKDAAAFRSSGNMSLFKNALVLGTDGSEDVSVAWIAANVWGSAADEFRASALSTGGTYAWTLGGYTAGAPTATGYVTITIGGVTYKLVAST